MMIVSPNNAFVQSTTQLALRCMTTDTGPLTYKFLRNGIVVDTGDNNYMIASASISDSGTYTCVVSNQGVESLPSQGHSVTVVGK